MAREDAAKLLEARALENDLPIDLMLRIMRDPTQDMHTRLAAARAAAPYCHPQLAAVQHRLVGPDGNAIGPQVVHNYLEAPKTIEGKVEPAPEVPIPTGSKH
jgi:hypothetical protein